MGNSLFRGEPGSMEENETLLPETYSMTLARHTLREKQMGKDVWENDWAPLGPDASQNQTKEATDSPPDRSGNGEWCLMGWCFSQALTRPTESSTLALPRPPTGRT